MTRLTTIARLFLITTALSSTGSSTKLSLCMAPDLLCESERDPDNSDSTEDRPPCGVSGYIDDKYILAEYPCASTFDVCKDLCFSNERCALFTYDPLSDGGACRLSNASEVFDLPKIHEIKNLIGEQVFHPRCFLGECQDLPHPRPSWSLPSTHSKARLPSNPTIFPFGTKGDVAPTPTGSPVNKPACSTVMPFPAGPTKYEMKYYGSGHKVNLAALRSELEALYQPVIQAESFRIYSGSTPTCVAIQQCAIDAVSGYLYRTFSLEFRGSIGYWRCRLFPVPAILDEASLFTQVANDVLEAYVYTF